MHRIYFLFLVIIWICSCKSTDSRDIQYNSDASSGSDTNSDAGTDTSTDADSGTSATKIVKIPDVLTCSQTKQEILIIDLRSGWWAGDGVDTYTYILPEIMNTPDPATGQPCGNIEVEYHHLLKGTHTKAICKPGTNPTVITDEQLIPVNPTYEEFKTYFEQDSWNDYTQLWILSGTDQDPEDFPISSDFFTAFLDETSASCIPILLAGDDCFIDGANITGEHIGLGNVFNNEHAFDCPYFITMTASMVKTGENLSVSTHIENDNLKDHVLFQDLTSIADNITVTGGILNSDSIIKGPNIEIIANNNDGKPVIGVGVVQKEGDQYPRPFILDSGWDRAWTIGIDEGTKTYIRNITLYLGLVGCIAEGWEIE